MQPRQHEIRELTMTTDNRIPQLITGLTLICCFTSDSVSQEAQTDGKETRSAVRVHGMTLTTETFDRDPGWQGVNNRSATQRDPITIRQDFGYSAATSNARGRLPGELGGFITPAGEAAFYGKKIDRTSLHRPLNASGTLTIGQGGTNVLLGFFNSQTVKEWRTPNTIAIRLNGRGDNFFAYVEYCTSKWRAGGDTTPFPSVTDPQTGRWNLIGYPCNQSVNWTLKYDPQANDGHGVVTATIGDDTAVCKLDISHKGDDATFDHFGILNVMKSADSGAEIWLDDIAINGGSVEAFDADPKWDGLNNRHLTRTRMVRPWFDFGYTDTAFAGGQGRGELGGQTCSEAIAEKFDRMACYGDQVDILDARQTTQSVRQDRDDTGCF
jgi:hypothetical protein